MARLNPFEKGFICGLVAAIVILFITVAVAKAFIAEVEYQGDKSSAYASEMEQSRRENGLYR